MAGERRPYFRPRRRQDSGRVGKAMVLSLISGISGRLGCYCEIAIASHMRICTLRGCVKSSSGSKRGGSQKSIPLFSRSFATIAS